MRHFGSGHESNPCGTNRAKFGAGRTRAAASAAESVEVAAIASRFATQFHDVRAIGRDEPGHEGIQDLPDGASYTRFLVIGCEGPGRAELAGRRIKTSFRFILSHRTG